MDERTDGDAHSDDGERWRAYGWGDPALTAAALPGRSGLELLQLMQRGELPPPPFAQTLGIEGMEFTPGRAVFWLTPREWHYNPMGVVHGGTHATLLDSAMGCAIHTRLEAGLGYTTLELSVRFVRPATVETGLLRCEGTVVSLGQRVATAAGEIVDPRGRVVATAATTCLLMGGTGSG